MGSILCPWNCWQKESAVEESISMGEVYFLTQSGTNFAPITEMIFITASLNRTLTKEGHPQ